MTETFFGHFIGGGFVGPSADARPFVSRNPAGDHATVFEAHADAAAIEPAVAAAQAAAPAWRRLGVEGRAAVLRRLQAALPRHAEGLAQAITLEMGKTIAEARAEVALLGQKIDGTIGQIGHELPLAPAGAPGEQRFHALGVVGIIGPFNFPLHLINTHLVPTLLTGNTVVVKPSEVTPLAAQRYAAWFADPDAGVPVGVFNLVHGLGDAGAALVAHPAVRGLVFTGSYATGRRIREATFDSPWKKVCLELGGKNAAVVLDDADLDQAAREIVLGALLTTVQRCTATSRVVATSEIAAKLRDRLVAAFERVVPGDPMRAETFMGPLANRASHERFVAACAQARHEGLRPLVEARTLPGGAFVTPALYEALGDEPTVREEVFGPHVAFEVARDEADAFARAAATPYGLSASLFSARAEAFERFYDEVPAGVLNFNRSTNGASGLLPFGGIGMSGNWHAAGSCAPRLSTYPVAVMAVPLGARTANPQLDALSPGV